MTLSIRTKLLIIFTVVFTIAFAIFGYVFYTRFSDFAVDLAKQKLQSDANSITDATIQSVYAEEIMSMVETQEDDHELRGVYEQFFRETQSLDVYDDLDVQFTITYVDQDSHEVITLVNVKPDESTIPPIEKRLIEDDKEWETIVASTQTAQQYPPTHDATGLLTVSSAPVYNADGETPSGGVLNVFIQTSDQIAKVQAQVRNTMLIAVAVGYPLLIVAIFLVSVTATRALDQFAGAARALQRGERYDPASLARVKERGDELGELAQVFDKMAIEVQAREEKLKQEVVKLKIEIDFAKQKEQVAEITESEFFQDMKRKKEELKAGKSQLKPPAERTVSTDDYMASLKEKAATMKTKPDMPAITPPADAPKAAEDDPLADIKSRAAQMRKSPPPHQEGKTDEYIERLQSRPNMTKIEDDPDKKEE